jgi:hypothetical protein
MDMLFYPALLVGVVLIAGASWALFRGGEID